MFYEGDLFGFYALIKLKWILWYLEFGKKIAANLFHVHLPICSIVQHFRRAEAEAGMWFRRMTEEGMEGNDNRKWKWASNNVVIVWEIRGITNADSSNWDRQKCVVQFYKRDIERAKTQQR